MGQAPGQGFVAVGLQSARLDGHIPRQGDIPGLLGLETRQCVPGSGGIPALLPWVPEAGNMAAGLDGC